MSKAAKRRKQARQARVPVTVQQKGKRPVRAPKPRSSRATLPSGRKLYAVVGAAAALVAAALIGFSLLSGNDSDSESASPPAAVDGSSASLFAGIPQDGIALGRPNAPVTLVEFADFQCPFCARFALEGLPEIVRRYVRTGKVRIEYRPLAFLGEDSAEAREMALAAGQQGRFWQFAHLVFENQGEENSGWVTEELLTAIANAVPGLDVERARADRTSDAVAEEAETAEHHAEQHGISGTPSFLAGPTGGKLERIEIQSLDAGALTPTLDDLLER